MLTVHLAGLIYFDACPDSPSATCPGRKRAALVPDGTKGDDGLPPHDASLWIEADRYESDDWWPDSKFAHVLEVTERDGSVTSLFVFEFRLPERAEVTFPDDNDDFKAVGLGERLPRLQDSGFVLDPANPETIARIPLRGGTLEPRTFAEVAVVQWSMPNAPDDVVITAKTDCGDVRTIRLRNRKALADTPALRDLGVEVVFSNGPDQIFLRTPHAPATEEHEETKGNGNGSRARRQHVHNGGTGHSHRNHFKLYGKLDEKRDGLRLVTPDLQERLLRAEQQREKLEFNHAFLRYLLSGNELPNNECTGSCC